MSEKLFVEVLPQDEALDTVQGWEFSIGDRGAVSIVARSSASQFACVSAPAAPTSSGFSR